MIARKNLKERRAPMQAALSGVRAFLLIAMLLLLSAPAPAAQTQSLGREQIEAALRQHVVENGPWKAENVEVRIASFQPASVAAGAVRFRILKPLKGITPGVQNFLLAADVGGQEAARLWTRADIKIFEEVVVTSHPLAHHETIHPSSVRLERRDISPLSLRPFTRIADVAGQQAARAIEVNEVLTPKTVDRATLVRRGSAVVLLYETGTLRVEAPGVANEGGKIGDVIQVKNPASGKLLRGVLLDAKSVRVN
jgi:flagella basal body P-ring formation protein FlgA